MVLTFLPLKKSSPLLEVKPVFSVAAGFIGTVGTEYALKTVSPS